jgi:hypothetical protein
MTYGFSIISSRTLSSAHSISTAISSWVTGTRVLTAGMMPPRVAGQVAAGIQGEVWKPGRGGSAGFRRCKSL